MTTAKKYLTTRDLAAVAGVHRSLITRLARQGRIEPAATVGNAWAWSPDTVAELARVSEKARLVAQSKSV